MARSPFHRCVLSLPGFGLIVGTVLAGLCGSRAAAQEPVIPFIEGLRERGFYDTALEYLNEASQRTDLPAEVIEILDLQRAMTQQQAAAASRVPEDRETLLNQAQAALAKFLSEHAQHPQAPLANSMLGELKFERARSLIWKVEDTESAETKAELQGQARALIDEAQGIYQTAKNQYQKQFDAFPKYIDEAKEEEEYLRKKEVESKYLRAWFNLVRCTYERGQTFDKGTEERKKTLTTASDLFSKIHEAYRTNQIGLHARLMMGKCFQEQDDLGRALGLYNEMLDHTSDSPAVETLQAIAQHFRLICLNDPQKNDHQLVIQEAADFMQVHRSLMTSQSGLGIQWEKAIAEEKLSQGREVPEGDREGLLRAALNDATSVSKYAGPYREPANAMVRRLKLLLGDKDREPRDFETAFERARGMIAQIQQMSDDMAEAEDATVKAEKRTALDNHLREVGRLLQLALDLKNPDSDPKAVAQGRYLLSFVLLRQGKALDATILASYCMERDRKDDPDTALNATEVAMAAGVSAWNQAPAREREFETRMLRDLCLKILELYPQSAKGGEARMRLGSVYRTMNQPLEAATWFLQVPETDPQYASARISAGQSYWAAWTQKTALASEDTNAQQTSPEDLQKWKSEARNLLLQGIQLTREKNGATAPPTDELVAGEVSLASIMNLDGEFAQSIERLTSGEGNSVVAAIEVPDGTERPAEGVKSRSFAGLTYRLLLRAYVGTQQIDLALQTMSKLEQVGGQDILAAYTQLGLELQEELKRLKVSNEPERLAQTRTSFEQFLDKVYSSREKSDYNSLLWIGETYYGLGQGVAGDPAGAETYFGRAADAYGEILSGGLASKDNKNAVVLRLARCQRAQQKYDEALKGVTAILEQNANALDGQFEAANILSDWGANKEPAKLLDAIKGIKDGSGKQHVWGWSRLARQLQQITSKDPNPELRSRFMDARYELSNSRRRYARVSKDDSAAQLKSGMAEIVSLVQVFRDMDDVSFARFDRLYQDLQSDQGIAAIPLERAAVIAPPEPAPATAETEKSEPTATPVAAEVTKEEGGSGWLMPVIVSSLCVGLGAGVFVFLRKPKQRVKIPGGSAAPKFSNMALADPGSSGPAFPDGLSFDAQAQPEFAAFGGVARKPAAAAAPRRPVATSADSGVARPAAVSRPAASKPSANPAATKLESGVEPPQSKGVTKPAVPRPVAPKPAVPKPSANPAAPKLEGGVEPPQSKVERPQSKGVPKPAAQTPAAQPPKPRPKPPTEPGPK